ncbi:MAG: DUF559 domain-containing protein [Alphaproteobacteria bacterium]
MKNNVFNVSIALDFHQFLAEKYALLYKDNPLGLSDVVFLMPSKRAVSSLRNAFLQVFELRPMILPQIKAIADFDEDELLLKIENFADIKEAISKDERIFYFIKMIMKKKINLNQAYQLSLELSSLLDEAQNLDVDLEKLQEIIPDNFSAHVQDIFEFLKIITQNWPFILKERNQIDVVQRQKELFKLATQNLLNSNNKIVVAGVSAPFVDIKNLMKSLLDNQNAEIYFYGIDMFLSEQEWIELPEIHPCFENKQMIDFLNLSRDDIVNVSGDEVKEEFVSELMRPAFSSENWQNINPNLKNFFENIHIMEADSLSQEALMIAILIRKCLEEDKEIALISPDRNLSRLVCSELKRFDVEVDDSAGRPLSSTSLGSFLRLILESVINDDVVDFLSLVKHPYFNNKDFVKEYERIVLRQKRENEELSLVANAIKKQLVLPERATLKDMLTAHINLAHSLCNKLFVKEEGRVASQLFTNILESCELINDVSLLEYKDYFDTLLSSASVRKNYNTHPKVKILGAIEARFNKFDVAIIGSCNEGMWPMANNPNPWLSESMKKDLGLSTYSYKVGISSFDFASALCGGGDNMEMFFDTPHRPSGTSPAGGADDSAFGICPPCGENGTKCQKGVKESHRYYSTILKEYSRSLRKNMTPQEVKVWQKIRKEQLGYKFRRQVSIDDKYIADFACLEKRLIIEIDGSHHNGNVADVDRHFYLENNGFFIIRFWNNEIEDNLDECVDRVKNVCENVESFLNTPLRQASPATSPARGADYSAAVYITRAIKVDGTPQVKSRFLLKIEALAKLLNVVLNKKEEFVYKKLSYIINEPKEFIGILPPAPQPPVEARPKHISASQIETWIKDPYAIYAKYVLSLYPLDDLNQELEAKDYGTIIHKILEIFYKKHNTIFPLNAKEELQMTGDEIFANSGLTQDRIVFWKARLNKIIDHLINVENQYSVGIKNRRSEVMAELDLGGFVLKAKADRIDELTNGDINVIDYKTGGLKSKAEIYSGYGPQLPAEGLIFSESLKTDVANLIYWQLGKKEAVFNDKLDELFLKTKEQLLKLIAEYNKQSTPYYSCPDVDNLPKYSDYEHLARLREWAVKGDGNE